MDRNKTIFFAFTGPSIKQAEKIFAIKDGYECWDLRKFTFSEFLAKLKNKIPPINTNVDKNYIAEESSGKINGITEKQFKECSWGLIIPEGISDIPNTYPETLFLINLYSPNFLYPLFYAGDMGIFRINYYYKNQWLYDPRDHKQNQAHLFKRVEFVTFFKKLLNQSGYADWYLYRAEKWEKEDWRLFVASRLFSNLKNYDTGKDPFEWQRESAEMGAILESLFTAGDTQKEELTYRLTKRVAVLLSSVFPDVEKDIKKLYKQRSSFVHGDFFNNIAKESKHAFNNIPLPDFNLLCKQKEYVRWSLATYLYLAKTIRENPEEYTPIKKTIHLLEQSIIDVEVRNKMLREARIIFDLLPPSN
jgi:hypothetical protein